MFNTDIAPILLTAEASVNVNGPQILKTFDIFGFSVMLTETMVIQWVIVFVILAVCLILTHNLQVVPTTKKQAVAEYAVTFAESFVVRNMGSKNKAYTPYIVSIFLFSLLSSLSPLFAVRAPTANLTVTATWSIMTALLIMFTKIKTGGLWGMLKSYCEPYALMLPLNIIGDIATPISLTLRQFANLLGGMIISALIAVAFSGLSSLIGIPFALFRVGIPAVLSLYFDVFVSLMQAFIFCSLTMTYIANAELEK